MLNHKQLEEKLKILEDTWLFRWLESGDSCKIWPTELMDLPPKCKYREKFEEFVLNHSIDELKDLEEDDFVEQATGESLNTILDLTSKWREVMIKRADIERDFI